MEIKNLEILERGILNKYKIVLDEYSEVVIEKNQDLEEISKSSIISNYLNLKKQKIDICKDKNNNIVALKLNSLNGNYNNIQSFLHKKENLEKILFLLIKIEDSGIELKDNKILEKDKILNLSNIKKVDINEYIFSDSRGLFIFIENKNKKISNEFLISPFLLHILKVFKESMKNQYEKNKEKIENE